MPIIQSNRTIIPACDVSSLKKLEELVQATTGVKGIGAYKVGFELALAYGLPKVMETVRKHSQLPVIYDHQKAGTDIPDTGKGFASVCKRSGVDAVIFFPQSGPETEKAWIKAAQAEGLKIIVGGEMTHPAYLAKDGGFLADDAPKRIYETAISAGITDFVVPGNKPEKIAEYKHLFESHKIDFTLYSPGLVTQGGKITDSGKAAGSKWHAIVGRAIYEAPDMGAAAREFASQL
ncbi:MAG: orotidine 5'-phosphate decarboxylase [Candidatus Micrarchaeota archaeon]|nr:orotidine 5'-phosphate decarboxylase [Candidatus Micrarchaeota archaeon]